MFSGHDFLPFLIGSPCAKPTLSFKLSSNIFYTFYGTNYYLPSYFIGLCRFSLALERKRRLSPSASAQITLNYWRRHFKLFP